MSYEKLGIHQFGKHLLRTGDLDPVYIALYELKREGRLSQEAMSRWLISYWCLYHCGLSCFLSKLNNEEFWKALKEAAENKTKSPIGGKWPRSKERRHWRGLNAMASFNSLYLKYGARSSDMIKGVTKACPKYKSISKFVQTHVGFGPWIAFKVADMAERVLGFEVDFNQSEVFMFKDPTEAALMLWRKEERLPEGTKPKSLKIQNEIITNVVNHLTDHFNSEGDWLVYKAPPSYDRPLGLQEIETILCKWKSHMKGHYPLNNDIVEIRNGLKEWFGVSPLAQRFYSAMPKIGREADEVS